jgi:hypothetical protein
LAENSITFPESLLDGGADDMRDRNRRGLSDIAEGLAESTSADRAQQWIVGVGIAALLALYAVICMISQRAMFLRVRPVRMIEMLGANAVAVGALYLSAALFLHCHWFWNSHPEYHGYAQLGKVASLVGVVGSLGYLFYNVLFLS